MHQFFYLLVSALSMETYYHVTCLCLIVGFLEVFLGDNFFGASMDTTTTMTMTRKTDLFPASVAKAFSAETQLSLCGMLTLRDPCPHLPSSHFPHAMAAAAGRQKGRQGRALCLLSAFVREGCRWWGMEQKPIVLSFVSARHTQSLKEWHNGRYYGRERARSMWCFLFLLWTHGGFVIHGMGWGGMEMAFSATSVIPSVVAGF